jgi:hypothetical protein
MYDGDAHAIPKHAVSSIRTIDFEKRMSMITLKI